jgi:murein DD-endopeptidase MepM/ murein hydrolase activator NlpD
MNQTSNMRLLAITLVNFFFCLVVLVWLFAQEQTVFAQEPPQAFLGPIYYGSNPVTAVFDHRFPYLSLGIPDPNECTQHNDGTDCNDDPPDGFGYDEHDGIDYDLNYEIVLSAADGTVSESGWSDPTNHARGLGLRVRVEHGNDYITEYGHLSTVHVRTGDMIIVDPDNRQGIIGISGNTGNSTGSHLHFGLINQNGVRVNPYGWVGPTGEDPWEQDGRGAASHDVWVEYPSITTAQFPDGVAISDPGVNNPRMIIDDASADFRSAYGGIEPPSPTMDMPMPDCWQQVSDSAAYNHAYRRVLVNDRGIPTCGAFWYVRPDAFTPPGDYDVFVHVPPGNGQTLGAAYTIRHNGQTHTAIVVQAAYPNDEHGPWAYIGRYEFAMQPGVTEYVRLTNGTTVSEPPNTYVVADAIMLIPAEPEPPPVEAVYVSFAQSGVAGNVPYDNEDILFYDALTGEWQMLFDGSDVGLAGYNLYGFDFREGEIYLSLSWPSEKEATQLFRFSPTSLGDETAGELHDYFTNEKLTGYGVNVDAFAFAPDGRYLLSVDVDDVFAFDDEDVFAYGSGQDSFTAYWDGTAVGLTSDTEDVNGVWFDPDTDRLYLTTVGPFSVSGISGDGADIFSCHRNGAGIDNCGPGLFWNGSAHGLGQAQLDGISLTAAPFALCSSFANGGFESQFLCWAVVNDSYSGDSTWTPTNVEAHSGQFSAQAEKIGWAHSSSTLVSSPIAITSNTRYSFSFYSKAVSNSSCCSSLHARIIWYENGQRVDPPFQFDPLDPGSPQVWTLYSSDYICPPPGADAARWEFQFVFHTLLHDLPSTQGEEMSYPRRFVDDVSHQTQPGPCPIR